MKERIRPVLSVTVNEQVIEDLDRLSKKLRMNRSQLVSNILMLGLSDARVVEKIGLVDLAGFMKGFQGMIRKQVQTA